MNPFNKIILLFFFFIGIFLFSIWEIVQTDFFGVISNKVISRNLPSDSPLKISFKNLELKLFPIGVDFRDVEVEIDSQTIKSTIMGTNIGLEFNIFDSFKTDLVIDKVYLKDGFVEFEYEGSHKKSSENSFDYDEVRKKLQEVLGQLGFYFRKIAFDEVLFRNENKDIDLRQLNLKNNLNKSFEIGLEVGNSHEVQNLLGKNIPDYLQLNAKLDDKITIEKSSIYKGINRIDYDGNASIQNLKAYQYDLRTKLFVYLPTLHNFFEFKEIGEIKAGEFYAFSNIVGNQDDFTVKIKGKAQNLKSDYVDADEVDLESLIDRNGIDINNVIIKKGNSSLSLIQPFKFYSFEKNEFLDEILVETKNFDLNNALSYLGDTLKPLKGKLSGRLRFVLGKNDFYFIPEDGFQVEKLRLIISQQEMISLESVKLNNSSFNIVNGIFTMDAIANTEKSSLNIKGRVDKEIIFKVPNSKIDLTEFKKIAGFNVAGHGELRVDVVNNKKKSQIIFYPSLKDFKFEGYELDTIKGGVILDILEEEIRLQNINGLVGQSKALGSGWISYGKSKLDISLYHPVAFYRDLKRMYTPLSSLSDQIPSDVYGDFDIKGRVSGGLDLKRLKVDLDLNGTSIYAYDEFVERLNLNFILNKEIISINKIKLRKGRGLIQGNYQVSLVDNSSRFMLDGRGINLVDFRKLQQTPYNINGISDFKVEGELNNKSQLKLDLDLDISDTRVLNKSYKSNLDLRYDQSQLVGSLALLNNQVVSEFNIDLRSRKNSSIKLDVDSLELKNALAALNFVDENKLELEGLASFNLSSKFKFPNFEQNTSSLNVTNLRLKYSDIFLNYFSPTPEVIIKNGDIKKWDIFMPGEGIKFQSKGKGDLKDSFDIFVDTKIKAKILENFNKVFARSDGYLYAKGEFYKKLLSEDYKMLIYSNDLSFTTEGFPFVSNGNRFYIEFINGVFKINEFRSRLKDGYVDLSGEIDFRKLIPEVNLTFDMQGANIGIIEKSDIYFTGKGGVIGKSFPYTVTGNLEIDEGNIGIDVDDLSSTGVGGTKTVNFLPTKKSKNEESLLSFNVSLNTKNPVSVVNSLADLSVEGQLSLSGNEKTPVVTGSLELSNNRVNKFFLNNNEFKLEKGTIYFYEGYSYTNPEIDVLARSSIRDYSVDVKAFGHVDELTFDLTSEPSLSQKDIFSLIAFGYTEDLSSNLTTSEQESLTTAGVGSLIFDRFKINKTLKKEFGLQVNLGTEIQETEQSLLDGRGAEGPQGRINSTTRIEVKKQMSKKLDLSLSTTMGTSSEQRQNMRLNYDIKDGWSAEGIYEVRSGQANENQNAGSSVGADIKKQWKFK
jgi:hypothetical protein